MKLIQSKSKEELIKELLELYSSFENVRIHYQAKSNKRSFNPKSIKRYKNKINVALDFDDRWQEGLDFKAVDQILSIFNSNSNFEIYVELGLYALDFSSELANAYGGDYGEEFYIYFTSLYEDIVGQVCKQGLDEKYKDQLKTSMRESFEGYGFRDSLEEIYFNYFRD